MAEEPIRPLYDRLRATISNTYYGARNVTMEMAADTAAIGCEQVVKDWLADNAEAEARMASESHSRVLVESLDHDELHGFLTGLDDISGAAMSVGTFETAVVSYKDEKANVEVKAIWVDGKWQVMFLRSERITRAT